MKGCEFPLKIITQSFFKIANPINPRITERCLIHYAMIFLWLYSELVIWAIFMDCYWGFRPYYFLRLTETPINFSVKSQLIGGGSRVVAIPLEMTLFKKYASMVL